MRCIFLDRKNEVVIEEYAVTNSLTSGSFDGSRKNVYRGSQPREFLFLSVSNYYIISVVNGLDLEKNKSL